MKELPIKRVLDDETEVQSIWIYNSAEKKAEIFALHISNGEVIVTDHSDYTKIYSVESLDFYNMRQAQ